MQTLESAPLWQRTLAARENDANERARTDLRTHFLAFRSRVKDLVSTLASELPALTVHDITHLDALWRVADQIAGPDYPITPAEAFVLGGAFLLHDAAHVLAAYPGGISEIKATLHWKDLIAQRYEGREPTPASPEEAMARFQVLRHLHAEQAHTLANVHWSIPGSIERTPLLENLQLRKHYGDLIGSIAASHHWSPREVAQRFGERRISPPAAFPPSWEVDALKIAFLLRTADAALIDDQRAPWFLFALHRPTGLSEQHWRFQAKLGQPVRTDQGELRISGSTFETTEREAWWLAYDTARMIDGELRAAHSLLRDEGRQPFAAAGVLGVGTPEAFAKHLPTAGWEPVGIAPRIDDVPRIIELLGGSKLYGDEPAMALRELLQNSIDAVRAMRTLAALDIDEGQVTVSLDVCDDRSFWLRVTDTGIGMSRHVLTKVLLDFGQSLWTSDRLREEWPGLASGEFESAGRFGIGFFSTFMLGDRVTVSTRRHSCRAEDSPRQLTLEFDTGVRGRPLLRESRADEVLPRAGTRVSVRVAMSTCSKLLQQLHSRRNQFNFTEQDHLAIFSAKTPGESRAHGIARQLRPVGHGK